MEKSLDIPEKYQKLTITEAFTIMDIPKATFYRNHLGKKAKSEDRISCPVGSDGKKYIPFDELFRVFGQDALNLLYKFMGEPLDTSQKSPNGPSDTTIETTVTLPLDEYIALKVAASRAAELKEEVADWKKQAQTLLLTAPSKQSWWKRVFGTASPSRTEGEAA